MYDDKINPEETSLFANNRNLQAEFNPAEKRETVRSEIAQFYVYAFFGVLLLGFIIGFWKDFKVGEYKDMLLSISGVLSGPLGFIIGFYFKDSSDIK